MKGFRRAFHSKEDGWELSFRGVRTGAHITLSAAGRVESIIVNRATDIEGFRTDFDDAVKTLDEFRHRMIEGDGS